MLDVRLISIIPPAPPVAQPSAAPNVTTQGATILAQLPTGSILSGFIVNRDVNNNPVLRTTNGDVVFASNFFLKIGSEVVIRVQNNAGQTSARIITVNGVSPEIAQTQSAFARDSNVVVGASTPQQTVTTGSTSPNPAALPQAPAPATGTALSSIVIVPTPQNTTLVPGTSLLLSLLGLNTPPAIAPSNSATQTTLSQLTSPTNPSPANAALTALLPENNPNISPAPLSPPAPTANLTQAASSQLATSTQLAASADLPEALAQTIVASVIATNEDGRATLDSTIGLLRAVNVAGLKTGDQLTLRVSSIGEPNSYTVAVANNAETPPLAPLSTLAKSWPALQFIVQLLGGDKALPLLPNLPQLSLNNPSSSNLGNSIVSFVAALKSGDFRGWLGHNNIKALEEKGYGALVRKAEGEFSSLARQFVEPPPGQWQSLFLPVAVAGEIPQVRAFIKRDKKKNAEGKPTGDEDTRFILEMELSQLGELQMDGLVKRNDDALRFDLIIRSHEPLPKEFARDIEQIYHDTAALTHYSGQISFQAVYAFPVHPLEETLPHLDHDVMA